MIPTLRASKPTWNQHVISCAWYENTCRQKHELDICPHVIKTVSLATRYMKRVTPQTTQHLLMHFRDGDWLSQSDFSYPRVPSLPKSVRPHAPASGCISKMANAFMILCAFRQTIAMSSCCMQQHTSRYCKTMLKIQSPSFRHKFPFYNKALRSRHDRCIERLLGVCEPETRNTIPNTASAQEQIASSAIPDPRRATDLQSDAVVQDYSYLANFVLARYLSSKLQLAARRNPPTHTLPMPNTLCHQLTAIVSVPPSGDAVYLSAPPIFAVACD